MERITEVIGGFRLLGLIPRGWADLVDYIHRYTVFCIRMIHIYIYI